MDNIEMVDGVASMAYAGELPWHGLGTKVDPNISPLEMMVAAGLDWSVSKRKMQYSFDGKRETVPGQYALTRDTDGKLLSIVGEKWHPVQNEDAFEFFQEYVDAGEMEMHTAGSLADGQLPWALAKITSPMPFLKGKDEVESYMLFSNPHKFGASVTVQSTFVRVVCQNTLTMALRDKNAARVRSTHRTEFDASAVKETLGIAREQLMAYQKTAEFLASKRYDAESLERFMKATFPSAYKKGENDSIGRKAQVAIDLIETQPGADIAPGTWWNAINAVTFMTDHVVSNSNDARMTNAWFGQTANMKLKALDRAVEFANAA